MRAAVLAVLALLLAGCSGTPSASQAPHPATAEGQALADVAFVHGSAGPWAVAGYRMSAFALKELALTRGSFDLLIVHHTPHAVKYSCIADGAAAQSGASVGKLNLTLVDSDIAGLETVFTNKKSGQRVAMRPTAAFQARFATFPMGEARAHGQQVLSLRDEDIFEVVSR